MKYIIIFVILVFTCIAINDRVEIKPTFQEHNDYLYKIMKPFRTPHKERIRDRIQYYAYKYNHPVGLFGRLIRKESGFDRLAVSHKDALGLGQVKRCWDREIYYCRDMKFGKYLNGLTNKIEHRQYYFWIGINLEMSARILRKWKDKYGTYPLSLVAYNAGPNSDFFRRCLKNPKKAEKYSYVKEIMNE